MDNTLAPVVRFEKTLSWRIAWTEGYSTGVIS
jgi:hypothetical protein